MDTRETELDRKLTLLRAELREYGSVLIAFSGGVDSTFLLKVAADELGAAAMAVTARSATYPSREFHEAEALARDMGVRWVVIDSDELDVPGFRENPPDRCYYCKGSLFADLLRIARENGVAVVCDGANADDLADHRPGRRAAAELGVHSPLAELGFTKTDIRKLSRRLGLPTWDKPAFACLASRFPYGQRITESGLEAVDRAEATLHELGFRQVRVRVHGHVARIEVGPEQVPLAVEKRDKIVTALKACGYHYVTLDLEGYRTGSLNELLPGAGH